MNDFASRLTSRKFILATLVGAFGVLAAAGVIPADAVARDLAIASPLAFIAVEGAADIIERHGLSAQTVADIEKTALQEAGLLLAPNAAATPGQPKA